MKIKYIAWKQVISSDVNRLFYGTQGPGLHNTGDQAFQNFNTVGENPGLWRGFTDNAAITTDPGFDIVLENSVNPLHLWYSINAARRNPIKINHMIWDRNLGHERLIIEPWYLGYMRILKQMLAAVIERDGATADSQLMFDFVSSRLENTLQIKSNLLQWIYDTQDGFCSLELDTGFMANDNLREIATAVRQNYYLVVKLEDEGRIFNVALMANIQCTELHPSIRACLLSKEKGGEDFDIEVAAVPASPDAQRFLDALYSRRNIILYGPPGTGKTHMLMELSRSFNAPVIFDDLDTEAPFRVTGATGETSVEWCTFHPNYTYESFVHGLDPVVIDNNLGFKPHIGPLVRMAVDASAGRKALLIIDEINRANTDSVFGDSIAVIDTSFNDAVTFTEPLTLDTGETIESISGSENLFIVGTMNSLDKSTSPLSSELRRRFAIVELAPSVEVLRSKLRHNEDIPADLVSFTCKIMKCLNERIREYCGKEYEFGQGYFWGLVDATEYYQETLAEILRNKILPHLRDILPRDCLSDFFGTGNLETLYYSSEAGFEFSDCHQLSSKELLNAFAVAVDDPIRFDTDEEELTFASLEEYEGNKINYIRKQLDIYKNVILSGCSGTGKSYYASKVLEEGAYPLSAKTHWHGSTEYSDVIEGIGASIAEDGQSIDYAIQPGLIRQLAENPADGKRLMIIESINKCNAAECFGELITLLEPDKRDLDINGYEGPIRIPEDMHFLCTMNPALGGNRLDSALKRRFIIIDFPPDYKALALHFGLNGEARQPLEEFFSMDALAVMSLAVDMLHALNKKIINYVGKDMQIGQACIWDLTNNPSPGNLLAMFDNNVVSQIEELCVDESIAFGLFGASSPILKRRAYGIEIGRFGALVPEDAIEAIREIIADE